MNIRTRSSGQNESPTPNAEVLAFSRPSLLAKAWHQSSSHPARMWTLIWLSDARRLHTAGVDAHSDADFIGDRESEV